jgi:hypothetical protein
MVQLSCADLIEIVKEQQSALKAREAQLGEMKKQNEYVSDDEDERFFHPDTSGLPEDAGTLACGQPENRYATVNGPSNKVRLMTSVFAWCGPCFTPFGAKKNAPVV